MGKRKPKESTSLSGPYIAAALICENIIRDENGVLTAVRIVDKFTISIPAQAPPNVPSDELQLMLATHALVAFKKGDSASEHELKLAITSPSGQSEILHEQKLDFGHEPNGGASVRVRLQLAVSEEGLFWVHVLLDGNEVTRMPLQVIVVRADDSPGKTSAKKERPAKRRAHK